MNINDKTSWFEEELKIIENNNDALSYKYILDFSETVLDILDKKGIKNKNKFLAKKLGTSPAYISKLFNGKTNFTVKKLVEISKAVDNELVIKLRPRLVVITASPVYTMSINRTRTSQLESYKAQGAKKFIVAEPFQTYSSKEVNELGAA